MVEDVLKENCAVRALESDVIEDLVFPSSVVDGLPRNNIYEFFMKLSGFLLEPVVVIDWFVTLASSSLLSLLSAFSS